MIPLKGGRIAVLIAGASLLLASPQAGGQIAKNYRATPGEVEAAVKEVLSARTLAFRVQGYRGLLHINSVFPGRARDESNFVPLVELSDLSVQTRMKEVSEGVTALSFKVEPVTRNVGVAWDLNLLKDDIANELHVRVEYVLQGRKPP